MLQLSKSLCYGLLAGIASLTLLAPALGFCEPQSRKSELSVSGTETSEQREHLVTTIRHFEQFVQPPMKAGAVLHVIATPMGPVSDSYEGDKILHTLVGVADSRPEITVPMDRTRHTLAHEYGHFVFEYSLRALMPQYDATLRAVFRRQISAEQWREVAALASRIGYAFNPSMLPRALQTQLLPYNELFADAFAVLVSNNPQAPLEGNPYADSDPRARYRDFSQTFDPEGWTNSFSGADLYSLLAPARSYIWRQRSEQRWSSQQLMAGVILAIKGIFADRIEHNSFLSPRSPEEMNLELIKRLEGALQDVP